MITLASITESGSVTRANEDASAIWQDDRLIIMAVLDGVTQMLAFPTLDALCHYGGRVLTPGGFAAEVARDVLLRAFCDDPLVPLATALGAANDALRARIVVAVGECSVAAFVAAEPRLVHFAADPRYVRPLLPATTVTLARLTRATLHLDYAYLSDSPLLHFPAGGAPPRSPTLQPHRSRAPDPAYLALRALPLDATYFPADYAHLPPALLTADMAGRFYHNFVDAAGQPDPAGGVGVLNGLPAMTAHLRTGAIDLAEGDEVIVCSDGFLWPRDPFTEATLRQMRALLHEKELAGYLAEVRAAEDAIAAHDTQPRVKLHDDATALWLRTTP